MANQILPFCPTDSGTNLPTQGDYAVDPNRSIGNSPGVASSKLNNKPLRQATFIASQIAQLAADRTNTDILDDANTTKLLAQLNAAIIPLASVPTVYLSGSGTHNLTYIFFIASGSATAGATYTNNGITYTVKNTVASGVQIAMTGNGSPTSSGTLTKASGTGDTTLTFYAKRSPISIRVKMVGGGGGGGGGGSSNGTAATAGGDTTFGASLTAGGGSPGLRPALGNGGNYAKSIGVGIGVSGTLGEYGSTINGGLGGSGGDSFFGGSGPGGSGFSGSGDGIAAQVNSGSGGGGGNGIGNLCGGGGGAGAFMDIIIASPSSSFAWSVGAAGIAGGAGGSGRAGGNGAAGMIILEEQYQ